MKPVTETIPKSLIPVRGRPFLHHQFSWLQSQGVSDVVLCVGYLGEAIRRFAGDGSSWKIRLQYVSEGETLRGTAGALRLALDGGALQECFFVLYGDSFLPIEIAPLWQNFLKSAFPATMAVFKNDGRWDRSNVEFDGQRVVLYDKRSTEEARRRMQFIDYGLSALSREVIARDVPPNQVCDLADVYHQLSIQGQLGGFEVFNRFYEIGSPQGLADLESYLARHAIE